MCRLLGYVCGEPLAVAQSLGAVEFDQFTALAKLHGDGWGMAWVSGPGSPESGAGSGISSISAPISAADDPRYLELANEPLSTAGLVHLRWATEGLAVRPENSHPFTSGESADSGGAAQIAFAHNGHIAPIDDLEALLTPERREKLRGDTESERYFAYLLQEIERTGEVVSGVLAATSTLHRDFPDCSLNALVLTAHELLAIHVNSNVIGPVDEVHELYPRIEDIPLGHGESAQYFQMAWRRSSHGVHVISSGVSCDGWEPTPPNTVLRVGVADREVSLLEIPVG